MWTGKCQRRERIAPSADRPQAPDISRRANGIVLLDLLHKFVKTIGVVRMTTMSQFVTHLFAKTVLGKQLSSKMHSCGNDQPRDSSSSMQPYLPHQQCDHILLTHCGPRDAEVANEFMRRPSTTNHLDTVVAMSTHVPIFFVGCLAILEPITTTTHFTDTTHAIAMSSEWPAAPTWWRPFRPWANQASDRIAFQCLTAVPLCHMCFPCLFVKED